MARRIRSSYEDLRAVFRIAITAKYISEKLQSCNSSDRAPVVRWHMRALDFDEMGVRSSGKVCGYVERSEIDIGPCSDYMKAFLPAEKVMESTPLIDVLMRLRDSRRVYVFEDDRAIGIITRGDLQKAPVRMFLFGVITLLEMHLARLIRLYWPNDAWKRHLKAERLEAARKIHAARKARKEGVDLVDCLQLCDEIKLILRVPGVKVLMRQRLDRSMRHLSSLEPLRNRLVHGQDLIAGMTWTKLIDLMKNATQLLELFESIDENWKA